LSFTSNIPGINLNVKVQTVEKRPREMMLRREFANAVGYLNQILSEENHLKFIHWDFHKFAKRYVDCFFFFFSSLSVLLPLFSFIFIFV
jgi:hypothetical protein